MTRDVPEVVTMAEIAREAGVHVSTVSRALSTPPGQASREKTREIHRIADRLGFRPNQVAASLRLQRTRSIGVLVPRLTDYVLARIYEGIDDEAAALGFTTFVSNTGDLADLRARRLEEFLSRRPDGIILGDARDDSDEVVRHLREAGVPYVLVSRRIRGHLASTTDDVLGGRLAGQHLAVQGHTRVGVIAGEPYASTGVERSAGFCAAMADAGAPVPAKLVVNSPFDTEGGQRALQELLQREPRLTAVFAVNDTAAIGAMGELRDSGRVPGQDVAVVGYNDIPMAAQLPVPLSSVASPMYEMGRTGARLLVGRIRGEQVRSVRHRPVLHARASSQRVDTRPGTV